MGSSARETEVLIVGAGPTGLVLALWLRRLGVAVRIIDQTAEPGTTSRALAVHARTLELYRQLGLADAVVKAGLPLTAVNLWSRGAHAARADFSGIGRGLSPFPYILIFPQDQHERLLVEHLRTAGVEVERRTRLLGFEDRDGRVIARIEDAGGSQTDCEAAYLAGCDGAHSRVRALLDVGFPGGTYQRVFYVADVELEGPASNHELHVAFDEADLLAVFPMKGEGEGEGEGEGKGKGNGATAARLIGTVKREAEDRHRDLTWADVSQGAVDRMKLAIDEVHWFSTYRVHHRVADHFGRGRTILLGDAAHVHSPVGGQGMNTGIGDAVNLAWKLAAVLRHRANARLLDSYEPERAGFAKRLVATTDRVFTFASRDGALARFVRLEAVPRLVPRLLARAAVRRFVFKTVSQILIDYRHLPLSEGRAGKVQGGDRLPWVAPEEPAGADNFTPLGSVDWQVHVYGAPSSALSRACAARGLPLHAFPWRAGMGDAGLARDAHYLIRPDGYVARADDGGDPSALEAYLDARELRCAGRAA